MASMEAKTFERPDETRPLPDKGKVEVVHVGGSSVMRATFEPGWRWSEHVRPIAGTESCQSPHLGYVLSGRLHVRQDDGTEGEVGAGDVMMSAPGHDAWVVGDEPCVILDFGAGAGQYAKKG